jgi:hypothetical protein
LSYFFHGKGHLLYLTKDGLHWQHFWMPMGDFVKKKRTHMYLYLPSLARLQPEIKTCLSTIEIQQRKKIAEGYWPRIDSRFAWSFKRFLHYWYLNGRQREYFAIFVSCKKGKEKFNILCQCKTENHKRKKSNFCHHSDVPTYVHR